MNMIINIGALVILTLLWLGFAAALIFNQAILDTVWQTLRGLPLVVQVLVWLLVLPVTAGLWIWEIILAALAASAAGHRLGLGDDLHVLPP